MILTANQTGNFNTAATWDQNTFTTTMTVNADYTPVNTTGISSDAYTAPNTTNAATGCWVYMAVRPTVDWKIELRESGVTVASKTISVADMPTTALSWIYFRLATPYVFTTTGAGAYLWRLKSVGSNSGSTGRNAALTAMVAIATDDRTQAPTTSDQCWIGPHNCNTAITVTVDGTAGDVRLGAASPYNRAALLVGGSSTASLAKLQWDTTASATLSASAPTIQEGGEWNMGTVASPYPAAYIATFTHRTANYSININAVNGKMICQGRALTYYKTDYVSGAGTAASPLVVSDAVDWTVGDYIAVTSTSANATNYNETEYKYIITKNSATSYVLSNTSGGAEAAFTYTHTTNSKVLNLTRNVVITYSTGTGHSIGCAGTTDGNNSFKWVSFIGLGQNTSAHGPSLSTSSGLVVSSSAYADVDYCVFGSSISYGMVTNSTKIKTYTGNIFYGSGTNSINTVSAQLGISSTATGHTFVDNFFIGNSRQGVEYRGVNCTFTNPHFSGNNTGGTSGQGAFYAANGAPFTMTTPNMHANRISGFILNGTTNSVVTSGQIGTKGANQTVDVTVTSNSANKILFDTCSFGSTTLVSGHLTGAVGATTIAFDTLNGTTNNHKWYTEYGSAQSTGSGLSDTTVRTSGTLNVRLAPEEATTGFKYEYKILAVPTKAVFALGFIERNAAFATDTCLVELFLPGSTVADASQTMATTVGTYLPFSIAATYNGSVSRYATVRISAKTTTASAYVYVADLFNGTNNITNFNTWFEGQPSSIMFEQLGDAAAVWAVPISTMTTSGTIGYYIVKKLLSVAKFLSLK